MRLRRFYVKATNDNKGLNVLFAGSERYADIPSETQKKKLKGLKGFFNPFIIAFNNGFVFKSIHIEGVPIFLIPSKLPRPVRYILHFVVSFFLTLHGVLTKKYQAVVAQSPFEALAPALALLPLKAFGFSIKPKLIIEIHADWKEGVMLYHRYFFSRAEKLIRYIVARFTFSQADVFRAISQYSYKLIPSNEKPVFVFPTFTDIESFIAPSNRHPEKTLKSYKKPYFIYAGMLIYLKGIHHLINAFKGVSEKYPDASLVIAGKGSDYLKLRKQAEGLKLISKIHFTGHVHQDLLATLIKESAALVLPSLTEGLGRVAIEALLLERPVIASAVGGLPEIIEDGKTGFLVPPMDEEALGMAMLKVLENQTLADCMGKTGKEHVLKKFDYSRYFNAYRTMIEKICDNK